MHSPGTHTAVFSQSTQWHGWRWPPSPRAWDAHEGLTWEALGNCTWEGRMRDRLRVRNKERNIESKQFTFNLRHERGQGNSIPYPVSRWRWDIDGQSSREFQDLNTEHQRHVGHLSYLLLDVLVLCGLLKVFGLCYFVHKSQDLPACAATSVPGKN